MFKDTVRINKNSHKSKNINYILKIFIEKEISI